MPTDQDSLNLRAKFPELFRRDAGPGLLRCATLSEGGINVVLEFNQTLPTFSFDSRSLSFGVSTYELLEALRRELQTWG